MSQDTYMRRALTLARTNLGQTWPNPSVGAVIVKNNHIIGEGCTQRGGRPHAETEALRQAGDGAKSASLYVSLEPCSHHGKTPPCVDAIIAAGISRVIIACRDPHPDHGGGSEKLKEAGIEVVEGVCEEEARELNRGFFSVIEKNRPYIALKIATSADGKIAYSAPSPALPRSAGEGEENPLSRFSGGGLGRGSIRWITGEASRAEVHRLRSEFDAILTGIGTVLADDPMLNVRLPGVEHKSPVRVVLDRKHRLPPHAKILPAWLLDSPDIASAVATLTEKGITRLLVEAGQGLNTAFLKSGMVDRVYWFTSADMIGKDGLDAFTQDGFKVADWEKLDETSFENDHLEIFERRGSRPAPG